MNYILYIFAEAAIIATDIAEVSIFFWVPFLAGADEL
jgi:Mn2+/Fe2+ NRAMP family transporter